MDHGQGPPGRIGDYPLGRRWRIADDASARSYWRVETGTAGAAIACGYGSHGIGDIPRDVAVLGWLGSRGLPVPRLLAGDQAEGWLLLEDLGDRDGEALLANTPPEERGEAALAFLEPLVTVSRIPWQTLPAWNQQLDQAHLRWELTGFEFWSVRYRMNHRPPAELAAWLDDLAEAVGNHPRAVCLRDYHLNNILVPSGGEVRVIDVQDCLVGPDTYDLASLIGDRTMPTLIADIDRERIIQRWAQLTDAAPGWRNRLVETGLQRAIKVLGTFSRLVAKGASGYCRWIPQTAKTAVQAARVLGAPPEAVDSLVDLASSGGG